MAEDPLRRLAETLAETLPAELPADVLHVVRRTGWRDRLRGRPGRIVLLEVRDGALLLQLQEADGGGEPPPLMPLIVRKVHGVVISRRQADPQRWLAQLQRVLTAMSTRTGRTEAATDRMLIALGALGPGAGVAVGPDAVPHDLARLADRLHGRVPADVEASVAGIAETLTRALPYADDAQQRWLITRIATDYLPTTLKAYLDLPPGEAELAQLREQLAVLAAGADDAYRGALADDAGALLANGTFRRERFASSALAAGVPDAGAGPLLPDVEQFTRLFRRVDADGDGVLTAGELQALMALLGEPLTDQRARTLLHSMDHDGDGRVTRDELVGYLAPHPPPPTGGA